MTGETFLNLVKMRQSVRGYLPKLVKSEKLERCLEAARLAPSACNAQPWKFIVVDESKVKKLLFIPRQKRVGLIVTLGYPSNEEIRQKKRKSLKEIISNNKY
jgi:nitroreductase